MNHQSNMANPMTEGQDRPGYQVHQSDPKCPDLKPVMAPEDLIGIRDLDVCNDDANQGGDSGDVGGEIEEVPTVRVLAGTGNSFSQIQPLPRNRGS